MHAWCGVDDGRLALRAPCHRTPALRSLPPRRRRARTRRCAGTGVAISRRPSHLVRPRGGWCKSHIGTADAPPLARNPAAYGMHAGTSTWTARAWTPFNSIGLWLVGFCTMLLYRKSTQGETARCAPPSKPQSAVALARVDGVMPSALPLSVSCAHAAHPCRGLGFACGALAPMRITFVVCPLCVLPFPEVRHKQNQDNSAPAPALWKWAEAILVLGPRSCFPLYSLPGLTPQNKRVTMITATGARLALLCAIAIGALAASCAG